MALDIVLYRIAWRMKDNSRAGHGDYCLTFEGANMWIKNLDAELSDTMYHWIEAMPMPTVSSSSVPSVP